MIPALLLGADIFPENGAVERKNFQFRVTGLEDPIVDLSAPFLKLKNKEDEMTYLAACVKKGETMPNFALGGFVCVRKQGTEFFPLTRDGFFSSTPDGQPMIVFESGNYTSLPNFQQNISSKKSFQETLSNKNKELSGVYLGVYLESKEEKNTDVKDENILRVLEHFNYFWDENSKGEPERSFYDSRSEYAQAIREPEEKIRAAKEGVEKLMRKYSQDLKTFGEKGVGLLKVRYEAESSQNEMNKLIKSTIADCNNIYSRWCSEQKLLHYLWKTEEKWQQQLAQMHQDDPVAACFLLMHTYQDPCPACRMTFIRSLKKTFIDFFDGLGVPFHMVVSYRQNYDREALPASEAPEGEILNVSDAWHHKALKHSISLCRICS